MIHPLRKILARTAIFVALLIATSSLAADADFSKLDPKAIAIKLPKDIQWKGPGPGGAEQIVLAGDPTKPGIYVLMIRWYAHHNSRPHFHPNDRYITVLSGTWWVNTGRKYDLDGMKPVPAGSYVTHYANEVHYDGAKDEDAILEIVGMGPATSTPAEDKQ
jgi:quercetin dioxygenase-like cupin family protein